MLKATTAVLDLFQDSLLGHQYSGVKKADNITTSVKVSTRLPITTLAPARGFFCSSS